MTYNDLVDRVSRDPLVSCDKAGLPKKWGEHEESLIPRSLLDFLGYLGWTWTRTISG